MKILKIVTSCYQKCPFFGTSMDGMECNHPYFNDKEAYANMIITQTNSHGRVPDKCPLRKESVTTITKLNY